MRNVYVLIDNDGSFVIYTNRESAIEDMTERVIEVAELLASDQTYRMFDNKSIYCKMVVDYYANIWIEIVDIDKHDMIYNSDGDCSADNSICYTSIPEILSRIQEISDSVLDEEDEEEEDE